MTSVKEAESFVRQVGDERGLMVRYVRMIKQAREEGLPLNELRERPVVYGSFRPDLEFFRLRVIFFKSKVLDLVSQVFRGW